MVRPTDWSHAYSSWIARVSFACAFLLLGVGSVTAQSGGGTDTLGTNGRHTIQGRIYFPSGRSIDSRLRVRLENMNAGELSVLADSKGEFSFAGLAPGNYTVVIEGGSEFETARESVYIDTEARGRRVSVPTIPRTYTVTIHLRLKTDPLAAGRKSGVVDASMATIPLSARGSYERALEAARQGDSQKAVDLLLSALSQYPQFPHALNELGVQYLKLGKPDLAAQALRKAIDLAPQSFTPLLNYGIALLNKKDFQEAATQLRAALRLKEWSPTAHLYLAIALINLHSYAEAEKELLRTIDVGGENLALVHYYLGGIYWRNRDYKRAADELEKYLQLEPKAPDAAKVAATIKELRSKPARVSD